MAAGRNSRSQLIPGIVTITNLIDSAFREMGVDAPISKEHARLILATESVSRALNGTSDLFDEAAHIRIHLCEINELQKN